MNADIIRMAQEAGFETKRDMVFVDSWEITRSIERLVALARADEREACALVCETGVDYPHPTVKGVILKNFGGSTLLAAAIRARSKA